MQQFETIDIPTLVARLRGGDEAAFSTLYSTFRPKIVNTARKMFLILEDAEEVAQEVFLIIWKNKENLKCERSFNAYVLAILKSLIIKKSKKEFQKIAYSKYAITHSVWYGEHADQEIEQAEFEQITQQAIAVLPDYQRLVYLMRHQQNLPTAEIAATMGISKRTVESHIYKASKSIKQFFTRRYMLPGSPFTHLK